MNPEASTDDDGPPDKTNVGPLGVPIGALTSDYYACKAMPERFNHPG